MEDKDYLIYCGDCFELFNQIDEHSVDLVLCDPPYNIGIAEWDIHFDFEALAQNILRVIKDNGNIVLFQGYSNVCETKAIFDKYFLLNDWIIYDRIKGRGAKRHFVSTREDILWYSLGSDYTFNKISSNIKKKTCGFGLKNGNEYRALTNVWYDISPIVPWSKERVGHPTQKPIALMDRCVKIFSNDGDIVLDPTMGSGTCGISCIKNGRKFIGFENNKEYFEMAKRRIEESLTQ